MSEERQIKLEEGSLNVCSTDHGKVLLQGYSNCERTDCLLTPNEVRELCAALRMASEEAQAKLSTGPEFKGSECIEVVAMSAREAAAFIERTDAPIDFGPADGARYREGARVWGFRIK